MSRSLRGDNLSETLIYQAQTVPYHQIEGDRRPTTDNAALTERRLRRPEPVDDDAAVVHLGGDWLQPQPVDGRGEDR
ncbi:hypothetical protein Pen02_79330 [Plantactinospora endophytica]|uniref:Uncharacterized protein n=1 Tax=Plantactinospora endophytica TaxID=673535 RepID=A0ABQ4EE35_9ACTN|nr:hypothetical protein Pen02_79330 [Plantactinospora endophytica]